MRLVLDIETTSTASHIWCCITEDVETGEVICHTEPQTLDSLIRKYDTVIGHNLIGFDAPVLKRLWNVGIKPSQMSDTLILSRLLNPVLDGGHSLKSWGQRFGDEKIDFTDYDGGLTDEMIKYCKQDVHLTVRLYKHLLKELGQWKDASQSIQIETDIAQICQQQEENGFKLDVPEAASLEAQFRDRMGVIEDELQAVFPPIVEERWSEKTGKRLKDKVTVFNVGSRKQIAERLMNLGWKPQNHTETGQPIVDEGTLDTIDLPEAALISEYLMLQKRVGLLDSWIKHTAEDGRIHGGVITNGAVTGRMTHRNPNLGQVPSVTKPYGKECRSLFIVEEDHRLIGTDLSGIELRCLAHYMQDDEWTAELLNGDIHTRNQLAAGLKTRAQAKTFIYATLYGAGIRKIGSIVGGGQDDGRRLLDNFYINTPKLGDLAYKVREIAKKGTIPGLDGRRVHVRHEHAALNTLLQSCGAIIAKQWCIEAHKVFEERQIPVKQVAFVHDEIQIEAHHSVAEEVAEIMVTSAQKAGDVLGFRCPVDAEAKIGLTWYDCH